MTAITALIIDDEPLARVNVRHALDAINDWEVVGELETVTHALASIDRLQPDVVFLDIKMPGQSGVDLAAQLQGRDDAPLVVFVTAFDEYAIQAFELFAFDYLLKPFDDARFQQTVNRIEQSVQRHEHRSAIRTSQAGYQDPEKFIEQLVIRSVGALRIVKTNDIYWLRASGNYVEVGHADGVHLQRVQLSFLEKHLDPTVFCRTHRSAIVRLDHVREIQGSSDDTGVVVLFDDSKIPVSSRYKATLYERLGIA